MLYTKYNDIFRKYTVIEELSVRGMEVRCNIILGKEAPFVDTMSLYWWVGMGFSRCWIQTHLLFVTSH